MSIEIVKIVATVLGVAFLLISAIGIVRLPEFYMRVHAPTKGTTLGLSLLLIATAIDARNTTSVTRAILTILFLAVTAPVGAHVLSRAALRRGLRGRGISKGESLGETPWAPGRGDDDRPSLS